jgi:NAD(P) transhydrogenase subunit alpha
MNIGILKEAAPEKRVCLLPESVATLVKMGAAILAERDAGGTAFASDSDYEAPGPG